MVAAAHPLAAEAGAEVLRQGGSAVDAAVAVQMVLGLVEPESSGIGGGAFLLHWSEREKKLRSYDGRETAPRAARPDRFLDSQKKPLSFLDAAVGGRSVGVPGVMRMLELAHQRHGRLPWHPLFDAAIRIADGGFDLSPKLREALERAPELKKYYPSDRAANHRYAETLRAIARGGARMFYEGDIAKDMVLAVRAHDKPGDLAEQDLREYRALEREPVCGPYRGWRICSMGPPSSGGVAVLQILGILERTGFRAFPPEGAYYVMADISAFGYPDDVSFVRHLVQEIGVAVVPGSSFFENPADGHHLVRFAFCKKDETLDEAERRLAKLRPR